MLRGSRTKEEMIYAKQCLDYAISLFNVIFFKANIPDIPVYYRSEIRW